MPCPARVSITAPPRHIAVAVMRPAAAAEHRPAIVARAAAKAGGAAAGQAWPYGPPPRDTDSADEHDPEKPPEAPGTDTDTLGTCISATAGTTATTARTTPASRNHRPAGAHRDSIPSRPRSRSATATTMNAGRASGASNTHTASHPQPERPRAALSATIRPATATRKPTGTTNSASACHQIGWDPAVTGSIATAASTAATTPSVAHFQPRATCPRMTAHDQNWKKRNRLWGAATASDLPLS